MYPSIKPVDAKDFSKISDRLFASDLVNSATCLDPLPPKLKDQHGYMDLMQVAIADQRAQAVHYFQQ